MPRFVLATTMWSCVFPETGALREQNLRGTSWADMIAQGCIGERFNDSYESAWQLVGNLPTERENVIQMYDDKKKLHDPTAVGVKLTEELNRLIADQGEGARRLKEQAQKPDNLVLVAELQTRNAEIENKIEGVTAQLQMLKIPFTKKIRNLFIGPKTRNSGTRYVLSSYTYSDQSLTFFAKGTAVVVRRGVLPSRNLRIPLYISSSLPRIRLHDHLQSAMQVPRCDSRVDARVPCTDARIRSIENPFPW